MTTTTDPAVLIWMIALAPRARPAPTGRHWWRELVVDAWFNADQAWLRMREAEAIGYEREEEEFALAHPRPTLKACMQALASGEMDPARVYPDN